MPTSTMRGTGFVYFLLAAWNLSLGGVLIAWTLNRSVFSEWTAPTYVHSNLTVDVVTEEVAKRAYVYIPSWIPYSFGLLAPGVLYLFASFGALCATIVPMEETPEVAEQRKSLVPRTNSNLITTPQASLLSADNYITSVLFFARFCSLPVIVGLLSVALVEKTGATIVLFGMMALGLNLIQYITSGLFLWVFASDYTQKDMAPSVSSGFDAMCFFVTCVWITLLVILFYTFSTSFALAQPTIPQDLRVCFWLFITIFSVMTVYQLVDVFSLLSVRVMQSFKPSDFSKNYEVWHAFHHISSGVLSGCFFIFLYQLQTSSGCLAL